MSGRSARELTRRAAQSKDIDTSVFRAKQKRSLYMNAYLKARAAAAAAPTERQQKTHLAQAEAIGRKMTNAQLEAYDDKSHMKNGPWNSANFEGAINRGSRAETQAKMNISAAHALRIPVNPIEDVRAHRAAKGFALPQFSRIDGGRRSRKVSRRGRKANKSRKRPSHR